MLIPKSILLNTGKLLISKLVPAVLLTLINIIYSRELSQSDYGSYQSVWTFLSVCIIFTAFGLPNYFLLFGRSLDREGIRKVLKLSLFIFLIVLVPIGFYLFFYSNYFDFATRIYFSFLLLFQTIYFGQEAFVISHNQTSKLIWINSIYSILLFAIHTFVLYVMDYQLSYCILGITLVSVFRNVLIWIFISPSLVDKESVDSKIKRDYSLFFWLGFNETLQVLTKWLDKLLLLFILSAAEFAIYFNGTFELPIISMLIMSFYSIITVYSSSNVNDEKLIEIFRSTAFCMSGMIMPVFSWMVLYASSIVNILFGSKYEESIGLFALSALLLPMRICNYTVLLQIRNQGKIIFTGSVIDFILSIVLMICLYPILNLYGLVLALVIATYVQAAYYLHKISKIYSVSLNTLLPFQQLFIRIIISFLLILGVKYLGTTFELSPLNNLIIGTLLCVGIISFYLKENILSFRAA